MQTQDTVSYSKSLAIPKSDKAISSIKATDELQIYRDEYESGLFLFVYMTKAKSGNAVKVHKVWTYRQAPNKANGFKAKKKKLGDFPAISHKEAQSIARDFKENGVDNHIGATVAELFTAYEREELSRLRENTRKNTKYAIDRHIIPALGHRVAETITAPEIVTLCESIERKGTYTAAAKVLGIFHCVYSYGLAHGYNTTNPSTGIRLHTRQHKTEHCAAITEPEELRQLLKDIDAYEAQTTRTVLQFLIYTGLRANEALTAEWWQVDFDNAVMTIPAEKMKRHTEHKIPLTRQTLTLLEGMKKYGNTGYIFKGKGQTGHRNAACLLQILSRKRGSSLGYNGDGKPHCTIHGFRTTFETTLKENMFISDIIKKMLAHGLENAVEEAYNRANYWELQKATAQWYCDYLDSLRDGTPKPQYPRGCTLNIN